MAVSMGYGPTEVDAADVHGVGTLMTVPSTGKTYRWVKMVDAVDGAIGDVVTWASTTTWEVTGDIAGGSSLGFQVAGIVVSVVDISATPYCWIQVGGIADVFSDGSVAAGEFVTAHATADGQADTMADGVEERVFGMALDADASGTAVTGVVSCHVMLSIAY